MNGIICFFVGHNHVPKRSGSWIDWYCSRCGGKNKLLIARSAEASRLTGLREMPPERRDAAIREMLRKAR